MTDSITAPPLRELIPDDTTQAKLAREVGCSESHLSDVLSGKKVPSLRLAAKMSQAMGVPIERFVGQRAGA